ncbi:hypothetical protein J3458_020872 [Metarhizium acridum]|uniref:uncharacterized protein n=1 Tax=Metarhizium acridum TaxID=92637 RepID=UPI001C6CD8A0|nr:hypothetical protein J3458_020872 [Metarhizium acridum]
MSAALACQFRRLALSVEEVAEIASKTASTCQRTSFSGRARLRRNRFSLDTDAMSIAAFTQHLRIPPGQPATSPSTYMYGEHGVAQPMATRREHFAHPPQPSNLSMMRGDVLSGNPTAWAVGKQDPFGCLQASPLIGSVASGISSCSCSLREGFEPTDYLAHTEIGTTV